MSTRVIWGEDDHEKRAKSLATAYATTANSIKDKPVKVNGLTKLVFWGHGDTSTFCRLRAPEFVKLVSEWKSKNSDLATVEMLTCNARHRQRGSDSYTEQVVTELTRKKNKKADKVNFRALPVATTKSGKTCNWSILKWHPGTATWAYIAATDAVGDLGKADILMHGAVRALEDFMTPRGNKAGLRLALSEYEKFNPRTTASPMAAKYKWDKQKADEYQKKLIKIRDETHIVAGTLGLLRWFLVDIK